MFLYPAPDIDLKENKNRYNQFIFAPALLIKNSEVLYMQLEWMGKNRSLIEKFILLFNTYARQYSCVYQLQGTSIEVSSAQIQTLEYIIEANGTQKMSEIATRIGITRGTFSNNVKKLIEKGYLEKTQTEHNKKEVYVQPTPEGIQIYKEYTAFIYKQCFKDVFKLADTIPDEHLETFKQILDRLTTAFNAEGQIN